MIRKKDHLVEQQHTRNQGNLLYFFVTVEKKTIILKNLAQSFF